MTHRLPKRHIPLSVAAVAATLLGMRLVTSAQVKVPEQLKVPEITVPVGAAKQVSPHVWMITANPNIAIVLGERATLAVDTGLGTANGATVAREAQRLSRPGARLYLTTTHFHPEHAAGDQGFPPQTTIIRNAAQQKELEDEGLKVVEMFRALPQMPGNRQLLQGYRFRSSDIVFDHDASVDLGGVTARLLWYGAAHTVGDELTFIEPDDVLISGDVVQNKVWPGIASEKSTFRSWRDVVARVGMLPVKIVVPDHTPMGNGTLVAEELAFLTDLLTLTSEVKRSGQSADAAVKTVTGRLKQEYADWKGQFGFDNLAESVERAYKEQ